MTYEQEILFKIKGYDQSYKIVHYVYWCDYEESAFMFILRKDNQLYEFSHMYSVYSNGEEPEFEPFPIDEDRALYLIEEWEKDENYQI